MSANGKIDSPDYDEVRKYSRKHREVEFRLKIDYQQFKEADPNQQRRLITEGLLRAIRLMPEVGVRTFNCHRLFGDVRDLAVQEGWV